MFPSFPHFYKLSRNLSFPLVSKTFPMGSLTDFWKPLEIDIFSLTDFYSNQGTHWKCFGNQRKAQNNRFLLNLNFEPQGKELGLRSKIFVSSFVNLHANSTNAYWFFFLFISYHFFVQDITLKLLNALSWKFND